MLSKDLEKQTLFSPLKLISFLVLLLVVNPNFAQNSKNSDNQDQNNKKADSLSEDQKLFQDLRKGLLGDRKFLERYFQKDFLDRMDKMFDDSIKSIGDDDFDQIFRSFQDSFQSIGSGLNNQWMETKEGMVLVVEGAVAQGGSFDLKVKEGQVSISGNLEKELGQYGKRMMSFKRSFPVPNGTDPNKVRIENKENGLHVVFPWKGGVKTESSSQKFPDKIKRPIKPKKPLDRVPLKKDSDDLVI